jgi:hypothetical protein
VDFRTGPDDGPQSGPRWGRDRTIRAHVIAALVTGASTAQAGSTRGLRLAGARISGPLTLAGAAVNQVTDFEQCLFDARIDLSEATTRSFRLRGCFLSYLEGRRITLRGEFAMQDCRLERLSLYAARVTEVTVSRTTLANPGHTAFNADLLTVEAAMFCHDMHVEGLVRLPGAHISGYLRIDGSHLANPGGLVLQACPAPWRGASGDPDAHGTNGRRQDTPLDWRSILARSGKLHESAMRMSPHFEGIASSLTTQQRMAAAVRLGCRHL